MPDQTYPILCKSNSCGKQLYGPVSYCPYCATSCDATSALKAAVVATAESVVIEQVSAGTVGVPISAGISDQQTTPLLAETLPVTQAEVINRIAPAVRLTEQKSEAAPEPKSEPISYHSESAPEKMDEPTPDKRFESFPAAISHPKLSGRLKWIAVAVVLVIGIAGYLIVNNEGPAASRGQGKRDSARIAAQDALGKGTNLSMVISRLPKLEKVLEAAKQLGDISPRYQEQIVSAESTVSAARIDRDNSVLGYVGKVVDLGRYSPDQISYAMGVIQKGDLAPREKIVAELLQKHLESYRSNSKANSKEILSDFTKRFSDFID